jgi:hypothetical protein
MNLKENSDFLDNFRQILSEANTEELLASGGESPDGDEEMQFSPPQKNFLSQIQMEK